MVRGAPTRALGNASEDAAAAYLVSRGFKVRDRNWRCREGEVDIVAEHPDALCFVEVRSRSTATWGDPAATVSFAKQRKVVRTALRYLFEKRISRRMVRFDVISVVGTGADRVVEHIPNAFDAGM